MELPQQSANNSASAPNPSTDPIKKPGHTKLLFIVGIVIVLVVLFLFVRVTFITPVGSVGVGASTAPYTYQSTTIAPAGLKYRLGYDCTAYQWPQLCGGTWPNLTSSGTMSSFTLGMGKFAATTAYNIALLCVVVNTTGPSGPFNFSRASYEYINNKGQLMQKYDLLNSLNLSADQAIQISSGLPCYKSGSNNIYTTQLGTHYDGMIIVNYTFMSKPPGPSNPWASNVVEVIYNNTIQ